MRRVLVDTGPLVAWLDTSEADHQRVKAVMATLAPPLFTCEAVLSEACFLLRRTARGPEAVLGLVARGAVEVDFDLQAELEPVRGLMARYRDLPMSLADACLVRMAELEQEAAVLTLDHHFTVYRRQGRHVLPLLPL